MQGIKNALKGVQYSNPAMGERLYELCRKATSRHIDRPDEIINQQVVYMINSDMHAYGAARDAVTCLKRRLQMDHPQKQYLAIILTSKVLQECHAAIGMYQAELLHEVACILRTQHTNSPAAARTRQAAMDALRHFGAGGVDAYRQARQYPGGPGAPPSMTTAQRDPAAVAAERESLLDEISRLVDQAGTSTELLNELILNKSEPTSVAGGGPDESAALRKELLSDVRELRRLLDGYMGQLAGLSGPDAEAAMKKGLEAVDQLDAALTLEKDVDAELKDLQEKGQLPAPTAAAALPPPGADAGSSSTAAAADAGSSSAAAAAAAAAKMQSMNLIDLDDEPPPAAAVAAAAPSAAADPFAPAAFAPGHPAAAAAAADPFAPAAAAGAAAAFPAAADPSDPFAALAAAPVSGVGAGPTGFDAHGPAAPFAAFPPLPASTGMPAAAGAAAAGPVSPPAAAAAAAAAGGFLPPAGSSAPPAAAAGLAAADPFADAAPAWGGGAPLGPSTVSAPAGFDSLAAAAAAAGPAAAGGISAGGAAPAAAAAADPFSSLSSPPQQQQQLGGARLSSGGFMPPAAAYGTPPAAAAGMTGSSPYGAAPAAAGVSGPYSNPAAGGLTGTPYGYAAMPTGGYGGYGGYAAPGPYGMPGQMGMGGGTSGGGLYPQVPSSAPYGPPPPAGPYPSAMPGMTQPLPAQQQQLLQTPLMQQQQQPAAMPISFQQPPQQQQQMYMGGSMGGVGSPPAAAAGGPPEQPSVMLSSTNPFASAGPPPPAAGGVGVGAVSNPFSAAPAVGGSSNVEQEWNAFFTRGQAATK